MDGSGFYLIIADPVSQMLIMSMPETRPMAKVRQRDACLARNEKWTSQRIGVRQHQRDRCVGYQDDE